MSEEKTAIEKLYADPKAKGFVNHLISAYLPVNKPTKVFGFGDSVPHKCNVCNHDLIDVNTVMLRMVNSKEYMTDSIEEMRKGINGEEINYEDRAVIKHITHGAILAWTGEKTTTYLCMTCIKDLLEMVTNGLLSGDKNIQWITHKMRRDEVFTHFKESPTLDSEEKEKVEKIQKVVEKKKVITFGDLEVLQQLKAKMEKENSEKQ
jgi:hypothetical protein